MDPEFAKDADDDKGSQFYVECGILSCAVEFAISTEFLSFLSNFVELGTGWGTNSAYFCWVQAAIEN